ncbi:Dihydrofolate reductase [compost metagenome]
MTISLIAAYDQNKLIGSNNSLPWCIPADLKFFRQTTINKNVVMGRKTFESLEWPLPKRNNIILTTDLSYKADGCLVLNSVESVIDFANSSDIETFIIGGRELYKQFLPYAEHMYITEINHEFEGDTYFPDFRLDEWKVKSKAYIAKGETSPYNLTIKYYEKQ